MAKRYELTDESWAVIADLFAEQRYSRRPRADARLMLNGIFWVLCSGAPWRNMPECFGPWSTVYQRFRDWRNQGTFDEVLKRLHLRLNEQGLINVHTRVINSTSVRGARVASGKGKNEDCALGPLQGNTDGRAPCAERTNRNSK